MDHFRQRSTISFYIISNFRIRLFSRALGEVVNFLVLFRVSVVEIFSPVTTYRQRHLFLTMSLCPLLQHGHLCRQQQSSVS